MGMKFLIVFVVLWSSVLSSDAISQIDYKGEPYPPYPVEQEGYRKGMTFGKVRHNYNLNIDLVGCSGNPKPEGADSCNAYEGDTLCSEALPILCIRKTGEARPPYGMDGEDHAVTKESYRGWAEGEIALTFPVIGLNLKNENNASNICEEQLGQGYRMANFHEGRWVKGMGDNKFYGDTWPSNTNVGGWHYWAYGDIRGESRFWVYIEDQNANCWQEDMNFQRELYKQNINQIRANPDAYPERLKEQNHVNW